MPPVQFPLAFVRVESKICLQKLTRRCRRMMNVDSSQIHSRSTTLRIHKQRVLAVFRWRRISNINWNINNLCLTPIKLVLIFPYCVMIKLHVGTCTCSYECARTLQQSLKAAVLSHLIHCLVLNNEMMVTI